ncbi:hypothetical protein PMZ80_008805 [Knufia obscura]|uniref:Uncharacterized protein n=1 Tax=Knufia obscura TaxID=1635080 RepID=A0ABR0REE9_9EURO|nr:hypothetical protein PMZ80_008805 [Knufia obscura]
MSRDLECGGYNQFFDRAHRDESNSIRRKVQRMKGGAHVSHIGQAIVPDGRAQIVPCRSSATGCQGLNLPAHDVRIAAITSTIPGALNSDFETAACDVFLATYCRHGMGMGVGAPGGFVHQLSSMLGRISLESPLHNAVTAIATTFAVLFTRNQSHASTPRKNYAKAVGALRAAIIDHDRSRDDDLLMTPLMLDFCDSVSIEFGIEHQTSERCHQSGALALVQLRGSANFKNEASKSMMVSLQTGVIHDALHAKTLLPEGCRPWFTNPQMPHTLWTALNNLTSQLTDVLARSRTSRSSQERNNAGAESDSSKELADLDKQFAAWYNDLPDDCLPMLLRGNDMPESIREGGTYQDMCGVYKDLQVAKMLNVYRSRRLMLLQELREYSHPHHKKWAPVIDETIQWLADGVCESVPFFLGNYADTMPSIPGPGLVFPSATKEGRSFPASPRDRARRATGAGAWLISAPLTNLHSLSQPREWTSADRAARRPVAMDTRPIEEDTPRPDPGAASLWIWLTRKSRQSSNNPGCQEHIASCRRTGDPYHLPIGTILLRLLLVRSHR